jgi:hypothetical protein
MINIMKLRRMREAEMRYDFALQETYRNMDGKAV